MAFTAAQKLEDKHLHILEPLWDAYEINDYQRARAAMALVIAELQPGLDEKNRIIAKLSDHLGIKPNIQVPDTSRDSDGDQTTSLFREHLAELNIPKELANQVTARFDEYMQSKDSKKAKGK